MAEGVGTSCWASSVDAQGWCDRMAAAGDRVWLAAGGVEVSLDKDRELSLRRGGSRSMIPSDGVIRGRRCATIDPLRWSLV